MGYNSTAHYYELYICTSRAFQKAFNYISDLYQPPFKGSSPYRLMFRKIVFMSKSWPNSPPEDVRFRPKLSKHTSKQRVYNQVLVIFCSKVLAHQILCNEKSLIF